MNCSSVLEVTAKAHGEALKATLLASDGEKVSQSLGGVVVSAVTCIDNRCHTVSISHKGSTLNKVAHSNYIGITAYNPCCICNTLALDGRGIGAVAEADNISAQLIHSCLKGKPCTGGGLKEQSSKLLSLTALCVLIGICDNILSNIHKRIKFFNTEFSYINKSVHTLTA